MNVRVIISFALIAMMLPLSATAQVQSPTDATQGSATTSPSVANEEEVRGFFANYLDRYVQKDIDGFLSVFSSKAIQNQKEGIGEIRKIYANFFEQTHELKYKMEETKIEIYQNGVEVKARYEIIQTLQRGGEKRVWRGNGSWFLTKEDGSLRILYLSYQHQKSL
jgi:hypothetical protein